MEFLVTHPFHTKTAHNKNQNNKTKERSKHGIEYTQVVWIVPPVVVELDVSDGIFAVSEIHDNMVSTVFHASRVFARLLTRELAR